jgi:hypothetical protein
VQEVVPSVAETKNGTKPMALSSSIAYLQRRKFTNLLYALEKKVKVRLMIQQINIK